MLVLIAVVASYLISTAGLFYWHFMQELAAGNVPKEMRFFEGSVKNGEFWYRVRRTSGNPLSPKWSTRLVRLNLESGKETDTDFAFDEAYVLPVWLDGTLNVFTRRAIYQATGNSLTRLTPAPFTTCLSPPFLLDDRVTVIYDESAQDDGSHDNIRLAHWIDDRWIVGRRIVLPGGRFWVDDLQRDLKVLYPRTSQFTETRFSTPSGYYFTYNFIVASHQDQVHLMLTDPAAFCSGYRTGLEYADEPADLASALSPANAPHEVSGWEPILANLAEEDWAQMVCDNDGLLFVSTNAPQRLVRRHFDGWREELPGDTPHEPRENFPWLAVDKSTNSTYLIHGDPTWGSATIRRIKGNEILPPHLIVPGFQSDYIARWQRVIWRLISVWLIPLAVLLVIQNWLTRARTMDRSTVVGPQVMLASTRRRATAFLIDLTLFVAMSWLLWRFTLWCSDTVWRPTHNLALAEHLSDLEWTLRNVNLMDFWNNLRTGDFGWVTIPFQIQSRYFGPFLASIVPVYLAKLCLERCTGVTPGKYLSGIRTVRKTLRNCGTGRLLLRDLAYYIDIPLLLTPIPAVISMILSHHNQRLGDRLADTIVVNSHHR